MSRRILSILLLLGGVVSAQAPHAGHLMAPPEGLTWRQGANGVSTAIAEGNPQSAGRFTMMLRLEDGAWIPPHFHNVEKRLVVITGALRMGMGEAIDEASTTILPTGGVAVVPANSRHYEGGQGQTLVALIADGPFQTTFVK